MITDEHRRNHLDRLVEAWDRIFDPEIVGLRHPGRKSPRGVAPACEESLHYALALLEMAERSRQGRAEAIVHRLVDGPAPAGFCALALSLIWHRHRRRLPSALIDKITASLGGAASSIHGLTTSKKSAAPAEIISEIFVLLSAARMLDDTTFLPHATSRLASLEEIIGQTVRTSRAVAAREFVIISAGLRAIDTYIQDPEVAAQAEAALRHFQNESLPSLEKNSGKRPGTGLLTSLVNNAIRDIQCGNPDSARSTFTALYACVMKVDSPSAASPDKAVLTAR